jgi:hypothetical protein
MSSPIKHKVEPLFGWLFVIVVVVVLGAVFHIATQPMPSRVHASKPTTTR